MTPIIDFSPFQIVGSDGNSYSGIRPSLIPAPFRHISYRTLSGKLLVPRKDPSQPDSMILGFSGSLRVIDTSSKQSLIFIKLVTLYKNNTEWVSLFYRTGELYQEGKFL